MRHREQPNAHARPACGQTIVPSGLSGVTAIAAGGNFSFVLKSDGSLVGWGAKDFGQSTFPAALTGAIAVAIAGGGTFCLAIVLTT
jgi:alpha-tubulin suppressor-like RCC1 family protein